MKCAEKKHIVEAFQYTGDPQNPGWPKGWLTTGFRIEDGKLYLYHSDSYPMLAGYWIVRDPEQYQGFGFYPTTEMFEEYYENWRF